STGCAPECAYRLPRDITPSFALGPARTGSPPHSSIPADRPRCGVDVPDGHRGGPDIRIVRRSVRCLPCGPIPATGHHPLDPFDAGGKERTSVTETDTTSRDGRSADSRDLGSLMVPELRKLAG